MKLRELLDMADLVPRHESKSKLEPDLTRSPPPLHPRRHERSVSPAALGAHIGMLTYADVC